MGSNWPNYLFCGWLQSTSYLCLIWAGNVSLQMMIFLYVFSTCRAVDLKTQFVTWIERSDVNGVYWFHFPYLITLLAYLCSQMARLVQIRYFMFDWTIYRIFVLNYAWKRYSLEMLIFVCLYDMQPRWLKTRFRIWIAWNGVNGAYTFHLSYLITVLALYIKVTSVPQGYKILKSSILCVIGRSADYLF
jgi:hypothetical protein